jgi:hypothetical protein
MSYDIFLQVALANDSTKTRESNMVRVDVPKNVCGAGSQKPDVSTNTTVRGPFTKRALISGLVNPNGFSTSAHFELGLSTAYGSNSSDIHIGDGKVALSPGVIALSDSTCKKYHFRLVASNQYGTSYGSDATFLSEACAGVDPTVSVLSQGAPGTVGKDIWTTDTFSYASDGNPYPGGGLDNDEIRVGGWGDTYYGLLQFNIASLPSHASSAYIELYVLSPGPGTFTQIFVDRVTQDWDWRIMGTGRDHLRLWWADRPNAVSITPTALPKPKTGKWYRIDITDLYNAWKAGTYPNFGIQLRPSDNMNRWAYFASSQYSDASLRPRLVAEP